MKKILPIAISACLLGLTGCGMAQHQTRTNSYTGKTNQTRISATDTTTPGTFHNYFPDVKQGEWYASTVEWVKDSGMMNGMPTGEFQPEKPITRAEVAAMLQKLAQLGYLSNQPSTGTTPGTATSPAPDTTTTPAPGTTTTPAPGTTTTPAPDTTTAPTPGTTTTPAPGTATTPAPDTTTTPTPGTTTTPEPAPATGTGTGAGTTTGGTTGGTTTGGTTTGGTGTTP